MKVSRLVFTVVVAVLVGFGVPTTHQKLSAAPVSVSGKLGVIHGDPLPGSNQPSRKRFLLSTAGGTWTLTMSDAVFSAGGGARLNGKIVEVAGEEVSPGKILVQSIGLSREASAMMVNALGEEAEGLVSGSKDYVTVLCKFNDIATEQQPVGFFTTLMGMTKPGLNHYWREVSYEIINLDGSAEVNWQTMASPRADYFDVDGNADLGKLATDCRAAHPGVTFSDFFGVNYVFNGNLDCCAWGGNDGSMPATWMPPWAWDGRVFGHETGHSIGMDHGNDQYGNVYGNRWDIMGSGRQTHVNAYHKDIEGWIPPAEIYTASGAVNQQIRLVHLAIPPDDLGETNTDYMMVKIPLADDRYYTLEARKKIGYDGTSVELPTGGIPFEGVVIHLVDPDQSDDFTDEGVTEIVDGTNNGNAADDGAAWVPGELFIDEANGVSVAIISEYDDGWIISINPNTDVTVTKSATPNPAVAGELLTYNVTVSNLGPGPATSVVVKDTLPAGTTYDENTLGPGACTGPIAQVLTCTLPGTLAAGTSKTFGITVKVSPSITNTGTTGTTTITNLVNVVAAQDDDPTATNNNFSLTTLVVSNADLLVHKECKPDAPAPTGTNPICTITVDNLGPSDAANVLLTDTHVSEGAFTILSAIASPGGPCAIAGGVVTCNLGVEPVGDRTTIAVTLSSLAAVDVNDTACVESSTPDYADNNNCGSDGVSFFSKADLRLTKTGAPQPVIAGETITHTIAVSNLGPSIATDVVVKDNLPGELTMISATPSVGQCIPGTPGNAALPLTCSLGNIISGGGASITVVSRVKTGTPNGTVLSNGAVVSGSSSDPDNGNNTQTAITNVIARADLAIAKTADAAQYKPNTVITYRIRVTNNGSSDAQNVEVVDTLPEMKQAVYSSNTNPGGCIFQAPKSLTCSLGTMAAATTKEFFIKLSVKGAQGLVTNSATVASTTTDPVGGNNSASVDVTIKGGK